MGIFLFIFITPYFPVNPSPVGSLMAPTNDITNTSVRLTWTLGFNGNAALTGGSVSYTAISNGVGSDQSSFTGETVTQYTVTGLQPLTTYRFNVSVTNPVGDSTVETVEATTLSNGTFYTCIFKRNCISVFFY